MIQHDIVIIGGGPAGLAAAAAAKKSGAEDILILERDSVLGGILNQCIHNGFGLHTFKEELTGPEYAARYEEEVKKLEIPYRLNSMVLDINKDKEITVVSRSEGLELIKAKAIILAMGCRERPRGALNIPGYRPAGIYTAGTAQRLMNIEGHMVGKEVVILGSGDIGLIMARRMTLEGAKVKVVAELMPYSGGLKRNIVQCLNDFDIPLKLSHTVVNIEGKERVKGITLAQVGPDRKPIPGTEEHYDCDTLLLSCGLIPENELTRNMGVAMNPVTSGPMVNDRLETGIEGVFACGNVLHVHDLVDYVSEEAALAGQNAAKYVKSGETKKGHSVTLKAENGVRYTVPQSIDTEAMADKLTVRFRVADVYKNRSISVYFDGERVSSRKKRVLAPGEMEQVILTKESLEKYLDLKEITICTEVDE
ncbi:NAD(P)/FAD-dependent oxidoreductase [Clostridium fessum]|uniref:NAD(P)/FAD-dependent oxidoreductase n=1 Tax=Clostridium fessum TaxID=2126740 RepID=UPI002A803C4A|nr:FAD-dependent oxidoreductase [Clostridium fessum]MDY4928877.1 FAD-dependent oxidoreductase [Clostridium fessum]